MKKILGAVLLAGFALVGCGGGGGDDETTAAPVATGDVYSQHSRVYNCYNAGGVYTGQYTATFTAERATIGSTVINESAESPGRTSSGAYSYSSIVPPGKAFVVILDPSSTYKVGFAYSFVGIATVDTSTLRVCSFP